MSMEAFKEFCHRKNPLYIYGAGGYGRAVKAFLEESGIEVSGFVVTDKSGVSPKVMGIPVLELQEIRGEGSFIIGVGKNYAGEIIQRLCSENMKDYFLLSDSLMEMIQRNTHYSTSRPIEKNFVNILLYHRVAPRTWDPWNLKVTPKHFEEHMRYIADHYPVLRFEEDWSEVEEPSVVVTFDDGYLDNYTIALPILEKYRIPATIFVSTGSMGTEDLLWWDCLDRLVMAREDVPASVTVNGEAFALYGERRDGNGTLLHEVWKVLKQSLPSQRDAVLQELKRGLGEDVYRSASDRVVTGEELKRLADSPWITIGGHTVTHSMLSVESEEMQKWEFAESKHRIEEIIGDAVDVMSYPFGARRDIAEITPEIAKECGYKKAAVNWRGIAGGDTDPFLLPRNTQSDCGAEEFAQRLRGIWYMYADEQ